MSELASLRTENDIRRWKMYATEDEYFEMRYRAASEGRVDILRAFVHSSWDADLEDNDGLAAIHHAIMGGHIDVVRALVDDYGADVNRWDDDLQTALHYAANYGHVDIAKFLLEHGANVNAEDEEGDTVGNDKDEVPLHYAVKYDHIDVVKLLLERESNVNVKDRNGFTPLLLAKQLERYDIVELLRGGITRDC